MTPTDRAALTLALEQARRDRGRAEQLDDMLTERSWIEVATFAASCCQIASLCLKPWETPPCHVEVDGTEPESRAARELLREMLARGVSRWHPDPVRAIEAKRR